MIIDCTKLLYHDPYFAGEIYSNQKEHNNTAFEPEQYNRPVEIR